LRPEQQRGHPLDDEYLCGSGDRSVIDHTIERLSERRQAVLRDVEEDLALAEPSRPEPRLRHEEIAVHRVARAHDAAVDLELRRNQGCALCEGLAAIVIDYRELHDVQGEGHLIEEWRE